MKVFVDNDVILDILLPRRDFRHSFDLMRLAEENEIDAYTSPLVFSNSFYIVKRLRDAAKANSTIKKIRILFKVLKIDQKIIDMALASEFLDFEYAVQYYAALQQGMDYFITRNKKDFVDSQLVVITPLEFLALRNMSQ